MRAAAPEQLLDLPRLVAGVRWRRRLWLGLTVLGLLLGASSALLLARSAEAVARIYVVHEDEEASDAATVGQTDVALFETVPIAAAAAAAAGVTEAPEDVVRRFEVAPVAANILELTVRGRTEEEARGLAQALCDAFVADHLRRTQELGDSEVAALLDRRRAAEGELRELDDQISGLASQPLGPQGAPQLEALYAARAAQSSQVQELGRRAEEAGIGAPRVAAGTRVIDPPRTDSRSPLVSIAFNAVVGGVLGLGLGLALAAALVVVRDRPVLRHDIAAHLGASVVAQVPGRARRRRSRAADEAQRVAATLARTVRTAPEGLSVLQIGCPAAAARLVAGMAAELAEDAPLTLVDDLPGREVTRFRVPDAVTLVDGAEFDGARPGGGRLLAVGSVEPGTAWTDLRRLGAETLLVVRTGSAAAVWLHDVARQLADAEVHVVGVVLVDPDPRDRTDGTLWDGLHHALRGRAAALAARAAAGSATNGFAIVPFGTARPRAGNGANGHGIAGRAANGEVDRGAGTDADGAKDGADGSTKNGSTGHGSSGSGPAATVAGDPPAGTDPVVKSTAGEAVEVT